MREICFATLVVYSVIMALITILMYMDANNFENSVHKTINDQNFDLIVMEGQAPLINEIYTVNKNERCKGEDEVVIHQDWMGFAHVQYHHKAMCKIFSGDSTEWR